jgi:hypothetical protein
VPRADARRQRPATLGADVIGQHYKNVSPYSYTLTRLHARYGDSLHDDLVFRAVDPIMGGRGIPDVHGEMSTKVAHDSSNNFQGRYVILHPWTGAVACAQPRRGVWCGRPWSAARHDRRSDPCRRRNIDTRTRRAETH